MGKTGLKDRLAAIMVKLPPRIQYQQGLAEIMFVTGYNESQVLEDEISLIGPTDSNSEVEEKAKCLLRLSQACSKTLTVRLS